VFEWGGGVSILLFGLIAYLYLSSLSLLFYLKGKAEAGLVLGVSLVSVLMLISMLDGVFYHGTPSAFLYKSFSRFIISGF
jgi:ABC-type glucose/galactose transport system permease subunit